MRHRLAAFDLIVNHGESTNLLILLLDQEIAFRPREPFLIPGSHPSLRYRGNELNRHKIWAQTDIDKGCRRYGYTGWQFPVANATVDAAAVPPLDAVLSKLSAGLSEEHNHCIFTFYKDGNDNIGAHHDKMRDIDPNSWIVVLKLGASRPFEFYAPKEKGDDAKKPAVIWKKTLEAGTAVFMNAHGNAAMRHGVPVAGSEVGPSGSIVTRCITTLIPWEKVQKRADKVVAQREDRKRKREQSKE